MILLLGASGYIGRTFAGELRRRGHSFIPLTRRAFDYSRFDFLFDYIRTMKPVFLINAAGYPGIGNVNAEGEREQMMAANAILPQMIARICSMTKTPWGHVSSGDIYLGAKINDGGNARIACDLGRGDLIELFERDAGKFHGFTELDEPNFSFHHGPSSFFSGAKALAEEAIREIGQSYIWRPRLLFNERDEACNALAHLQQQSTIYDYIDSMSHLDDFVKAALDLWEIRAPFGIYNMTNPGAVTTRQLAERLQRIKPGFTFKLGKPQDDPTQPGTINAKSHCVLDVSKLLGAGVRIRPLADAIRDSLDRIKLAARPSRGGDAPPLQAPLA
jgi:dTDP-4-dehydrorhamnose reductase